MKKINDLLKWIVDNPYYLMIIIFVIIPLSILVIVNGKIVTGVFLLLCQVPYLIGQYKKYF